MFRFRRLIQSRLPHCKQLRSHWDDSGDRNPSFGVIEGVYRTRVGYTGGEKKSPTYHSLGNHTEALQIDFNPQQISFAEVAGLFWKSHSPLRGIRSRQYMTAIWFHDASQQDAITSAVQTIEEQLDAKVQTPVLPLEVFYMAEDYHQKYYLQNSPLQKRFSAMYPVFADFNNSTAAARLNGFVGGHGSKQLFDKEGEQYGIPIDELNQFIRLDQQRGGISCSGS